jgi:hypothetical protein
VVTHHHDVALVENPALPAPPADWKMWDMPMAINHIAITYQNREAWLLQLAYLQAKGVKFDRRIDHGMTHSLYVHDPNGYGVELLYDVTRRQSKISDLLAPAARFGREIHDRQPQTVRIRFLIEGVRVLLSDQGNPCGAIPTSDSTVSFLPRPISSRSGAALLSRRPRMNLKNQFF